MQIDRENHQDQVVAEGERVLRGLTGPSSEEPPLTDNPNRTETNSEVDRLLQDAGIDDEYMERMATHLGSYVHRCFRAAKQARETHERTMLDCLRQREGVYDPQTLAEIQEQGGSEIFMMLTQLKVRSAKAWITEVMFQKGGLPFDLQPTPMADLPAAIKQEIEQRVQQETERAMQDGIYRTPKEIHHRLEEVQTRAMEGYQRVASERADRMRTYIEDILVESEWARELTDFIDDFLTYPVAYLKGPVNVMGKRLAWQQDMQGTRPKVESQKVRKFKRVSPFDMYHAPDARSINDGYLIERMKVRRKDLYRLIGIPGYDENEIRAVINEYGESGYRLAMADDEERNQLEGRLEERRSPDVTIDVLNFWGSCRGQWLIDHGVPPQHIPDPDDDYEANIMVVGEYVIRAALNPHPLGHRPYQAESFERVNGKIYGKGLPQIIEDIQRMCNAAARALANNMALASGPMVEVQVDRLADGETTVDIYPWRQFQTTESKVGSGSGGRAVNFFQPNSNAEQLMNVFKFFSGVADEYTGIPPYSMGANVSGGAASTASGLGMLIEGAARGVKLAISGIDRVIEGSVRATFNDVMIHDPVEHIKGDLKIKALGSKGMLNREQQNMRRLEMLQVMGSTGITEMLGEGPTVKMLRDIFSSHNLDPDILPDDDELKRMIAQRQAAQQAELEAQQNQAAGMPTGRQQDNSGAVSGGADTRAA